MTATDRRGFAELLAGVYALKSKSLSEAVLEIWWRSLAGYDLAAVADALGRHVTNPDTGQFLPMPADVVKMLGGTTKDASLIAWSKLDMAVRRIGSWTTVVFDDPLIHRVVDELGGWVWLCSQTEKEWPFVERRFCEHYRVYRARGETPPYPAKLVGATDAGNVSRGHEEQQPALIGDPWACAQVIAGGSCERAKFLAGEAARLALESLKLKKLPAP